jgi:hypothetical protein
MSDKRRKAMFAAIRRAQMGVGSRGDIRTAHKRGKKVLKSRRKNTARFLTKVAGKSKGEVRAYTKEHKKMSKEALRERKRKMKRRRALMQAYRGYRTKRGKIHKKYGND